MNQVPSHTRCLSFQQPYQIDGVMPALRLEKSKDQKGEMKWLNQHVRKWVTL